jgi:site-specific DNA-methyltransferase (adenine-specific)
LVLTDPPYDKYTHKGACAKTDKLSDEWGVDVGEIESWHVLHMVKLSGGWVIVFCSLEMLGWYQSIVPDKYVRGGVWDRVNPVPQMSGDRPAQAAEGIAIMWNGEGRKRWNGGGSAALWRYTTDRVSPGGRKIHPTQKPERLIKRLLSLFPGETILDPFMGSGTTLRAAKDLGRRAIGIEIEEKYCEIAVERLRQGVLF